MTIVIYCFSLVFFSFKNQKNKLLNILKQLLSRTLLFKDFHVYLAYFYTGIVVTEMLALIKLLTAWYDMSKEFSFLDK